jgi:CDP-diacylglycerol--glycerol-3-phosphate 3-phosphatidyltransferase
MPSIYQLKTAFQNLLRPMIGGLVRLGLTANMVTVSALLLSLAVGATIAMQPAARWPLLLLPATLFVRMALNAIDGMMAREHDQTSRLGAILNELGDVLSDAALYLPLGLVPGVEPLLLVPAVVLAVVSEMTGVVAIQIGAERRYDGPMGKSDRAVVFGVVGLLLGLGVPTGRWLHVALAVVLLLLIVTVVNRARRALAEASA